MIVKYTLEQSMIAQKGSRSVAILLFLHWCMFLTAEPLPPAECLLTPIDFKSFSTQSRHLKFVLPAFLPPSFFNIGSKWGWAVTATPLPLYPWKTDPLRTV